MVERALAALEEANSPWLIESLRFTGFFSPAATIEQDWWRRVVGAPSEAQTTRARIGGYQEAGLVDHRRLLLSVEPTRFDWRLTPLERILTLARFLCWVPFRKTFEPFSSS
jgi:hypothetical protein